MQRAKKKARPAEVAGRAFCSELDGNAALTKKRVRADETIENFAEGRAYRSPLSPNSPADLAFTTSETGLS
jgi:hypothetical protein